MKIIGIVNNKGGVGKSTTARELSAGLARRGARVLTVDFDPQGQIALTLGVEFEIGIDAPLLVPKLVKLTDVVVASGRDNWDVLPADGNLNTARDALQSQSNYTALADLLKQARGGYDFIVIDSSPAYDALYRNVLMAIDTLIVPVKADYMSSLGINDALEHKIEAAARNSQLRQVLILPTFVMDDELSTDIQELLSLYFTDHLAEPVRSCKYLAKAPYYHQTVYELRPSARGAQDYERLVSRWR